MQIKHPKISIVTPVFNQVDYLETTIQSVLSQNYPNLEYIIVDGGSKDGTLDIIKKYESKITKWISELDNGMYDALNKGFSFTTGDIMCWINSDDILLPKSLFGMAKLFDDLPEVSWVQGLNSFIDSSGITFNTSPPKKFSFMMFLNGDFKWIQQESTFWRRSLWEKTGSKIDKDLKLAGDFELWFRFFQHEKLYNTRIPIGAWRKRDGQLSQTQMSKYLEEVSSVINAYTKKENEVNNLYKIKQLEIIIKFIKKAKVLNPSYFISKRNNYYNFHNIDIKYSYEKDKFLI